MAVYKLRYFNLRGRAELARLLFHYAGQEFEDIHIGFEDWPTLKQSEYPAHYYTAHNACSELDVKSKYVHDWISAMPFKQLPVLEVDGQSLSQSNAIARYLASKFKLNGQTDLETALSNMYVDHIEDLMSGKWYTMSFCWWKHTNLVFLSLVGMRPMIMVILHEKDDAKLKELADKYLTDNLAPHVSLVEKQLKANGTGYLVGSGVSINLSTNVTNTFIWKYFFAVDFSRHRVLQLHVHGCWTIFWRKSFGRCSDAEGSGG